MKIILEKSVVISSDEGKHKIFIYFPLFSLPIPAKRVTRIGEEIYHSNGNSKVAIVVGGNHMGFVRSPEKWPQNGDLTCEISKAEYIEEISTTFVAWVSFLTTGIDSGNILAAQATRVANIIKPSIDGFELENSFYYQGRLSSQNNQFHFKT